MQVEGAFRKAVHLRSNDGAGRETHVARSVGMTPEFEVFP